MPEGAARARLCERVVTAQTASRDAGAVAEADEVRVRREAVRHAHVVGGNGACPACSDAGGRERDAGALNIKLSQISKTKFLNLYLIK